MRRGAVHGIVGPMYSGKTTELELQMRRHQHARKRTLLIKYAGDTRYERDPAGKQRVVVTHDQRTADAQAAVRRLADVAVPPDTDVILIDEVQFLPDAPEHVNRWADAGIVVIFAGLDGDFERRPFPVTAALIPLTDTLNKRTAVCMRCGANAPFSHRKVRDTRVELIGGDELYEPLCRACWER